MAIQEIPWIPDLLNFTLAVTLSGVVYRLTMQWVDAPSGGCWLMSIATNDGVAIESGIRLVAGTRFAWRRVKGNEPVGGLILSTLSGLDAPDVPSIEDMQQRRVVLVYDDLL